MVTRGRSRAVTVPISRWPVFASTGKYDLVKLLTHYGADIEKQTLDGYNALDSATTLPILKYLKPMYAVAYH